MAIPKSNIILIFFFTFLSISCRHISIENKLLTVGKAHMKSYAGKNGLKHYTYFINGVKFVGSSSFDNREFADGDMFLVYADKTDPNKTDMPFPTVKISPIDSGSDSICMSSLGINLADFRLISNLNVVPSR